MPLPGGYDPNMPRPARPPARLPERPTTPPISEGPGPGMPPTSTAGRVPPKLSAGFQKFSDAVRANPHVQRLQQQFSSTPRGQKIAAQLGAKQFKKGGMVSRDYGK